MSASLRYVGRGRPIADAALKVAGALVYGSDLQLPGMLHAALVLSPYAHARVGRVDTTAALAVPGVVAVYSHHDAPTRAYSRYRIVPGQENAPEDETVLAATARHVGDRVAVVVASTRAAAKHAARLVEVEYELLPAALSVEFGEIVYHFEHATTAPSPVPPDAIVTETTVGTQRLHHAALEPHMCLAEYANGTLTVHTPCQSVYGARTVVAELFELPYNRVRVIKVPMGGSFGGKQEFILEPLVSFLAMRLGLPVKLVLDREECIAATMVRPAQRSTVRTVLAADGTLLDIDVRTVLDAGGYVTSSLDYADAMAHKLTRLYRAPRYGHSGDVVVTNTPVAGGMRGWGAPDIVTCMELHLDHVARVSGRDPVALRLANLVAPGAIDPVSGMSLGDAEVQQCLLQGAHAFRWSERVNASAGEGRYRRGVGVACGGHKNGMLSGEFPESSTVTLKMNEDGSVHLVASLHEVGAGTITTMKVLVAEELGIDPDLISVGEADTNSTPFDFGCFGSRMTYVVGAGVRLGAQRLRERVVQAAAELLEASPDDLHADLGRVEVAGAPGHGLAYAQVVQGTRMRFGGDIIVTSTYRSDSNPGSYSVQFAEVEVDVLTGLVQVTDFLAVVDIGKAINPLMVEGQCRGAVQAGIGSALCEEIVLDDAGRPLDGGFKNYHLVNSATMPRVEVLLIEHDGDDGPYGAKSVGEIAFVPTAAAVVNAVNRALGTEITELPASPERILAALAKTGGPL